uniref:VWFA domain-containing protein n=1 Tax=Knipowitschia caucasica TaxID=637954 RepID=A0AAV2KTW1_KNICA
MKFRNARMRGRMDSRTSAVGRFLGLLGFLSLWLAAQAQMKIPPETVQQWANVFSAELREVSIRYSGSKLLQKKLKDVEPIIKILEIDGRDLVKDYSDEIERMLGSKMKSVKVINELHLPLWIIGMGGGGGGVGENMEGLGIEGGEKENKLGCCWFLYVCLGWWGCGGWGGLGGGVVVRGGGGGVGWVVVEVGKVSVGWGCGGCGGGRVIMGKGWDEEGDGGDDLSMCYSGVGEWVMLCCVVDKERVVGVWREEGWGSKDLFFKSWDGVLGGVEEKYIQAATSPKDIIIMFDMSGSMKGLKMTIAKHTINTILDTLGENDFVNVIAYTDYVRYVEPCFKGTLVQADLDNREHFKLLVEDVHVKGEAKINKAMKEAFKILNEARTNGQGSMCNQAIMLITDGAMEDFESVFEEYNWPDRRVRVFTYLIGREMTFAQNTKWIACNNKGYYTHIATLADVQENVMEYLHVLSRPMVINHDHDIIWTEAYMDTVLPNTMELFNTKAQSLLLMTSVAMPVFSKKKETLSHGILLGVVGTDVPLQEVMKLAPRYMLGPHGYSFLITNNGYILAHPDLRPLYKDGKKLKPKPNYNSVDLAEVEWEDTDELLRTAMVRGETGSLTLNIRASLDKAKRPLYLVNDYFYTNIDETPFSFGMALTQGHGSLMFMGNVSVEEGLHDLTSPDLFIATEWTYCETDIDPDHRKYSQLQAAIRYLLGKEPDLECDEVLLSQLLFDAVVTAPLEAYWNELMLNDRVEPGAETAFLGTRSGLMRVMRYAGIENRVAKRFLTAGDKDNLFSVDHFPLWYRLAVENTPGSFYYYLINDKGVKYVIATTSVTVSSGGKTAMAGGTEQQRRAVLEMQRGELGCTEHTYIRAASAVSPCL